MNLASSAKARSRATARSATGHPAVSVIVPHYNDLENLALCLDRLEEQSFARPDFEIIVADNDSPVGRDAVERVLAGRARLVLAPHRGAGPARNAGAAAAAGGILAFIDSDCMASPGWLAAGVAALDRADIIGGDVKIADPVGRAHNGAEAFEKVFAFQMEDYVRRKGFAGSGNLFVRAADFRRVGGFVTGKSEDMEWSHRATTMGLRLDFERAALVYHPPRRNWAELKRKWQRVTEEMYGIAVEQPHGRLKWLSRSLAMPASGIAHLPRMAAAAGLSAGSRLAGSVMLLRVRWLRMTQGLSLLYRRREDHPANRVGQ